MDCNTRIQIFCMNIELKTIEKIQVQPFRRRSENLLPWRLKATQEERSVSIFFTALKDAI